MANNMSSEITIGSQLLTERRVAPKGGISKLHPRQKGGIRTLPIDDGALKQNKTFFLWDAEWNIVVHKRNKGKCNESAGHLPE